MKHIKVVTSETPASANLWSDHPNVRDSLKDFVADPLGVLRLHFDKR